MKRYMITELVDGKTVGEKRIITKSFLDSFWEYLYFILIFGLGVVFGAIGAAGWG